jgi:hypothetical protein
MVEEIRAALAELGGQKYEIAGFYWQQGWNDMCTAPAIPEYAQNLVNLVKDLRKEFNVPNMPVVVGELGNGGPVTEGAMFEFRKAQEEGTKQIKNALFIKTTDFARPAELSPCPTHGHHWFANAESYFLIGDAAGEGMKSLLKNGKHALPAHSEVPYLFGRGTNYQYFTWDTTCPTGCPFAASSYRRLQFTGRWATYTAADTFYPTWGDDDVLYSPWTDGSIGDFSAASPNPGQCKAEGSDPLYLTIGNLSNVVSSDAGHGRYPCGSLMYNGIWYYSTYLLTWTDPDAPQDMPDWGVLEPWVGFRYSTDKGVKWTDPTDPAITLLEPHHDAGAGGKEIMIGAPHFVDFGKNMQHAPVDGRTGRKFAYMVAHGADPGVQIAAHNSWIQGDNIYLIRILMPDGTNAAENAAYMNTPTNWQYYARNGTWMNWDRNNLADVYGNIQAIAHWSQRLGNVSMTYNAALGKYMMVMSRVVTGNKDIMDGMLLESDAITGPFRLVQYLPSFGVRAYFLNIPSKFISADGRTMWLSFSANYWWYTPSSFPGAVYAWCLREFKLSTDPNPLYLSGKIEAEFGTKLNGAGNYYDDFASGGWSVAYLHTTNAALEFKDLAAATRLTIRYATVNNGTCSVYINGAHATDITVRSTGAWYGNGAYADAVVNMAVPDGATLKLQNDSGDVGVNLDYIMLEKAAK